MPYHSMPNHPQVQHSRPGANTTDQDSHLGTGHIRRCHELSILRKILPRCIRTMLSENSLQNRKTRRVRCGNVLLARGSVQCRRLESADDCSSDYQYVCPDEVSVGIRRPVSLAVGRLGGVFFFDAASMTHDTHFTIIGFIIHSVRITNSAAKRE